ncbi:MAG TPA: phosphatase PAP2 family protein [Candidatus Paceibacterota bacterium]
MPHFAYLDPIDKAVSIFLHSLQVPVVHSIFSFITFLANTETIVVVTTLITAWLLAERRYNYAALAVLTVAGSALCSNVLKLLFLRPRPEVLLEQLATYSFPSGHATSAIALYGVITYILLKIYTDHPYRKAMMIILIALIILIGFSRVYLGFHYLSDVVAGYLVGALWLLLAIYLFEERRIKE